MTRRDQLVALLRVLLGVAVLALLARRVALAPLLENLAGAHLGLLAAASAAAIANIALQAVKWWWIVRHYAPDTRFPHALGSVVGGCALGILTPGRIGEMGRGIYLPHGDSALLVGAFLLDRVLNFIPVLLLVSTLAYLMGGPWTGTGCLITAGLVVFFVAGRRGKSNDEAPAEGKLARALAAFRMMPALLGLRLITISVLLYLLLVAQYTWLLRAFESGVSIVAAASGFVAIHVAGSIPLTPGGMGTREVGATAALEQFGVSQAAALNSAVILFVLNIALPAVVGLFVRPERNFRD